MFLPLRIEIGFDKRTSALVERLLSFLERDAKAIQLQIDALTKRLADSQGKVSAAVNANPDPNPND